MFAALVRESLVMISFTNASLASRESCSGFRVWGLGFRVKGLGFRVQGLGFRVELPPLGLSAFRVEGLRLR